MACSSRLLRLVFKTPSWIYRLGLGRLLGYRFLAVTHRGRKTGRVYETVLEVIHFDPGTQTSLVVSAYGDTADWYRNLRAAPALRVRTGKLDYAPLHTFLTAEQTRETAIEFCRRHRWEAKLMPGVLKALNAGPEQPDRWEDPVDLLASLPMVGFRPMS